MPESTVLLTALVSVGARIEAVELLEIELMVVLEALAELEELLGMTRPAMYADGLLLVTSEACHIAGTVSYVHQQEFWMEQLGLSVPLPTTYPS